ncbi:MAG: hypothetical protein C5S41_06130 [Candidatus Methanomarinus sp.]|jgi:hypothetical protein|nr:MAG: hypothetical protein C5S41_06130 [ANME-2 cluster archaeon]
MFRPRIYVDTSVIGGCFDEEFDEYSLLLFDEFISGKKMLIISDIVLFELEGAPEIVKNIIRRVPSDNIEYIPLNEESIAKRSRIGISQFIRKRAI